MIALLSLLSGASGLVYEVVWARRLAQLLGSGAWAQAATLAAFLGGLAAGSVWLGRRAGSGRAALRFYARLEWAVAAAGLAAPLFLRAADAAAPPALALAALLGQAFLMGGAVPALCGALGGETQRGVGRVYAANALGAVAGALAGGFALIPLAGLDGAFLAAAALNAAAALLARAVVPGAALSVRAQRGEGGLVTALPRALVAAAVFASGFVALTYETAWTRALALVLGSSAYSFAEMLAAFILGLSAGSALASSKAVRRRDPALVLAVAELGAGAAVLLTLPLYDKLPFAFLAAQAHFPRTTPGFYGFEAAKLALAGALVFLPTGFLGLILPAAARLWSGGEGGDSLSADVGTLLSLNTAGNVLGAFAGLWLLPWLSVEGLLRSGTTVHLAVGAGVLLWARPADTARRRAWALAGLAAVCAWRARLPRWDQRALNSALYRLRVTPSQYRDSLKNDQPLYVRDDREATVCVTRFAGGELSLRVNGKTDASNGPDMRTQRLLGELPLLLAPGARRALMIGWGSGVTAGAMLRHPLETLDAVELVPAVVEASRFFAQENRAALRDPRLRLALQDARAFLRRPDAGPYDVVVSEPSNPWMAGVGDLFTREFYGRVRAKLAPGGLMAQWLHAYEMDDASLRLMVRTFRDAFPHATLWRLGSYDLLLVGSDRPLSVDPKALEAAYARDGVWQDLRAAGMLYPATALSLESAGERTLRELAGEGPLNEERRPRLEYDAPLALYRGDFARSYIAADDRVDPARRGDLELWRYLAARGKPRSRGELVDVLVAPHGASDLPMLRAVVAEWTARAPEDPGAAAARRALLKY